MIRLGRVGVFTAVFLWSANVCLAFNGPLRIRNAFPPFQGLTPPPVEMADCRNTMEVHGSYASTHHMHSSDRWDINVDLEVLVTELLVRKRFASSWEVNLAVPALYYADGFLDSTLESYHDTFGFSDYGRSKRPRDEFLFTMRNADGMVVNGEKQYAFSDVRLGVKREFLVSGTTMAVAAFLEFPTGDADHGFGSGALDGGFTVLAGIDLGENTRVTLNGGYLVTGGLHGLQEIDTANTLYGGADLEWVVSENWSANIQLYLQQSPLNDTAISTVDETSMQLAFGGSYLLDRQSLLQFSFTEDPNTTGAPDFMLTLGYLRSF